MDFMVIHAFQLENLSLVPTRFLLIDLRRNYENTPELPMLAPAVRILPESVPSHLKKEKIEKDFPIVLMCEDGETSKSLADDLQTKFDYNQIYIVAGGLKGLLSELG